MDAEMDFDQAEMLINRIAELAEAFAQQSGVGGVETAGHLVGYLATHPRDIEPFLRFGVFELPTHWVGHGCLTWHDRNGAVTHPDFARRARTIKQMEPRP